MHMSLTRTLPLPLVCLFLLYFIIGCLGLEPRGGVCPKWAYHGEYGPEHWGSLCINWRICGRGKEQSPVDIKNTLRASSGLGPVFYKYLQPNKTRSKMEYNGNNVEIKVENMGELSKGPLNDIVYYLNVIFFHTPSEHFLAGTQKPLEVQLVHLSDDGYMAVLSILFDYGRSSPFLHDIIPHLTNTTDVLADIPTPDLTRLLKAAMVDGYYFLPGSLTSPPCTQGISWIIARKVLEASDSEISAFSAILVRNTRPLQVIGERYILEYIPFGGVDTFIFDEKSWFIKALVAFGLVVLLFSIVCIIYICDFALRPFMRPHKKQDYTEIL